MNKKIKELEKRIRDLELKLDHINHFFNSSIDELYACIEQLEQGALKDFEERISKLEGRG